MSPSNKADPEPPSDPVLEGFKAIKENNCAKFIKVLDLVQEIKKLLLADPYSATAGDATNAPAAAPAAAPAGTYGSKSRDSKEKNYDRAVEMLDTDVNYIMNYITELEKTPNKKRADVLLQFLMEATEKRTAEDFAKNEVNRKKLLHIIAKLKLWVPPVIPEDHDPAREDAEKKKKKEEAPFVSRKEKDKDATDVVKELFGLRCNQWGMDGLLKSYGELGTSEKLCLLCFSGFKCEVEKDDNGDMKSKSLEIKKRILIHWWVGEGLIDLHRTQSEVAGEALPGEVEQVGERILKVLIEKGFIEAVMKRARESSRVTMHPFVHSFVTALAKRAGFFDINGKDGMMRPSFGLSQRACLVKSVDKLSSCKQWEKCTDDRDKLKRFEAVQTLFNVNEPIIDIKPEWFTRMTNLVVLHLGSWKSEPEAVEHIEVEDAKFLDDLKLMGKLKLFSLQGVSTIMKLTESVCKLENLVILDLRECHNLEELPTEIGSLRSLTHLDITNCHLLTNLPKGISLLSNVEVLKGFVIYDQDNDQKERNKCALSRCWRKTKGCVKHDVFRLKNKEICTLQDLEKLKKLRQLSLVVNTDSFPKSNDVEVFMKMEKLTKLKISWEKSFKDKEQETSSKNQGDNNASQETSNQGDNNASQETSNQGDNKASQEMPNQGDNKALKQPSNQGDNKESKDSSGKCGWCFSANKTDTADADGQQENRHPKVDLLPQIVKLELWCYPKKDAPYWLHPKQLKNCDKLYIKGGELDKVPGDEGNDKIRWDNVTTLRLKYLPNLRISWLELKDMFQKMTYLEKWKCDELKYFPCDQEGVWQKS